MKAAKPSVFLMGLLWIVSTSQSTVNAQLTHLSIEPPPISAEMRQKLRNLAPMLTEKIRSNPDDSGPYVARAGLWCRLREYELAIPDARQAIRLDAQSSRAHSWLGGALAMSGKPKPAISEFEKALELGADKSTTYKMLAQCRAQLGEYNRVLRDVDAAIERAPDDMKEQFRKRRQEHQRHTPFRPTRHR
ncbi:MAG: tetratricopeptide repeat protein [Planctomycetota bacterium]